jgi:hypothetical protein
MFSVSCSMKSADGQAALGLPVDGVLRGGEVGDGGGEGKVVVLAGRFRLERSKADLAEFLKKGTREREAGRDGDAAAAERGLEVLKKLAAGDVPDTAVQAHGFATGDGDRAQAGRQRLIEKQIVDGGADAGGVEGESRAAGEAGAVEDLANLVDDHRVRGAERIAVEEPDGEPGLDEVLAGDRIAAIEHGRGVFHEHEGGVVALLAEVETEDVVNGIGI